MKAATYRRPSGRWRHGMASPQWVNETVDVTFTNKAVEFIADSCTQRSTQTFFLYLALSAPHSTHLVPKFAEGTSQVGVHGDMVWLVDWCVGKIRRALEEHRVLNETLLIVTSDHGPLKGSLEPGAPEGMAQVSNGHQAAGKLRGFKGRIFEGGHRVPFVTRWPRQIPCGRVSDQPLCLVRCDR